MLVLMNTKDMENYSYGTTNLSNFIAFLDFCRFIGIKTELKRSITLSPGKIL